VDWENVLEEIEGTGQKHFESMIGYMAVIMEYIYKWEKFREEVIQNAVRVSMMPKYNMLRSAGLVHIPGVVVGMIVAGADPIGAVVFQVVVMFVLLSVSFFTSFLTALLTYSSALRQL